MTILQPQAQPLYGGISPHYLLALLAGHRTRWTAATWSAQTHAPRLTEQWHDALAAGRGGRHTAAALSDVALRPVRRQRWPRRAGGPT